MKVGIKYCGGCSPAYDRVDAAKTVMSRLGASAELVAFDDPGADLVFAVMGCGSACADLSGIRTTNIIIIHDLSEVENYFKSLTG